MHGASGLPAAMVQQAIELGITKFNVNTEVRQAYLSALQSRFSQPDRPELLPLLTAVSDAMQAVVVEKLRLFGSSNQA